MLSRIKREGQKVFLKDGNGSFKNLNGVQDVSLGYQSTISSFSVLGTKNTYFSPTSPQTATLNINSLLFYNDVFYDKIFLTEGFSGKIEYKKNGVVFEDAHLVSYSSSCSIGEIPSISMQADIYGSLTKSGVKENVTEEENETFKVAGYNSISLQLDSIFETNRVQSYSFSAAAKRKPLYSFNSKSPEEVVLDTPVEASASFSIEVDDYEIETMHNMDKNSIFQNLIITLKENSSDAFIQRFNITNVIIESENYASSIDSSVSLNLSVKGFMAS